MKLGLAGGHLRVQAGQSGWRVSRRTTRSAVRPPGRRPWCCLGDVLEDRLAPLADHARSRAQILRHFLGLGGLSQETLLLFLRCVSSWTCEADWWPSAAGCDEPAQLAAPLGEEAAALRHGVLRRFALLVNGGQRFGNGPQGAFVLADGGGDAASPPRALARVVRRSMRGKRGQLWWRVKTCLRSSAGRWRWSPRVEENHRGDDAPHPGEGRAGRIEIVHHDGAAQQRVDNAPEALLALHQSLATPRTPRSS